MNGHGDREGLIHSYDVENNHGIGMDDLAESDGEPGPTYTRNDERERTVMHTKQNSQV